MSWEEEKDGSCTLGYYLDHHAACYNISYLSRIMFDSLMMAF
jgi:hypothetical protein